MGNKKYVILVGAPKAGTTTVAAALAACDDVAVARIKEPRFFTDFATRDWNGPKTVSFMSTIVDDWGTYDGLFADAPWRMDASTDYLSCPVAPERLARFAEKNTVKIVAVLRDPVSRILSEFQHTLRDGYQSGTLAQSLALEAGRTAREWHPLFRHVARSRYAKPIQRYRQLFGDDFKILDFHTLHAEGAGVPAIVDFLEIDDPLISRFSHENKSFAPRSQTLNTLMNADGLLNIARRIVPAGLRRKVRGAVTQMNGTTYRPTEAELGKMRAALADDIAWCIADAQVPTDHWHLARRDEVRAVRDRSPVPSKIMAGIQP